MSESISIKFSKSKKINAYIENSFEAINSLLDSNSFSNIYLISDDSEYTKILLNLLAAYNVKEVDLSSASSLKNEENSLYLVVGKEDIISSIPDELSFAYIPTSIKAMADFSIYAEKSLDILYINSEILVSMSDKDFYNNFSYIMRLGLVKNLKYYIWLIDNLYEISDKEIDVLNDMLTKAVEINKAIVESDDLSPLTFGSEFALAIKSVLKEEYSLGECLALGMIASAHISWKMDLIKMEYFYEIRDMFVPFNLPISIESKKLRDIEKAFSYRNESKTISLIKAIGRSALVGDIPSNLIFESIDFLNFDLD